MRDARCEIPSFLEFPILVPIVCPRCFDAHGVYQLHGVQTTDYGVRYIIIYITTCISSWHG